MRIRSSSVGFALLLTLSCAVALAADFAWDWRNQETIGRHDPSLNNTSRLTEPERAVLLDAVIVRLRKPMIDRGYDGDRIREIASTTRLRFVDLGEGKPAILATSIGLEGGCDELTNCPFWIFQRSAKGYMLILDTVSASYTVQQANSNGFSDIVTLQHVSSKESRLTLYKYQRGKYVDAGCAIATWPAPKNGEIQEPEIAPCQAETTK